MPGGLTRFKEDWLTSKDRNGHILSEWCHASKESRFAAFCTVCNKKVKCDNQGLPQLLQHANSTGHKQRIGDIIEGKQLVIAVTDAKSLQVNSTVTAEVKTTIQAVSHKDATVKAELLWTMKVVASSLSYSSCDGLKELLQAMFPGAVPADFSLGSSKVSNLISEAVGPYFRSMIANDCKSSGTPFTVLYDETTNSQVQKQLDIRIRYWSVAQNQVTSRHLKTYLMGHATGHILAEKLLQALTDSSLSVSMLLTLGSDGPNVNKTVWKEVNESVLKNAERGRTGLLEIGSCTLHVVHNAFAKGLEEYGKNISEFVLEVYQWFKLSAARREDFAALQEKKGVKTVGFLKHVECRWLTLEPAITRIIEQFDLLKQHFLTDLPKTDKSVAGNSRYNRIKRHLESKDIPVQLHFLKSICVLFTTFLSYFQREEPLIHVLFDECTTLLRCVMGRFIRLEVIRQHDGEHLTEIDLEFPENQLKDIDIGKSAKKAMKTIATEHHKLMLLGMKKFLIAATKHLQAKLPLHNTVIRHCRCLNPIFRHEAWTIESVKVLVQKLPKSVQINEDQLCDEWRLYQLESVSDNCLKNDDGSIKRIDHFWRDIFNLQGNSEGSKYPRLTVFVKCLLVVTHGNADVERGFSQSSHSVTDDRVRLTETSVNGLRSAADGLTREILA